MRTDRHEPVGYLHDEASGLATTVVIHDRLTSTVETAGEEDITPLGAATRSAETRFA